MATASHALGIDIGGSGIKGAVVNVTEGAFVGDRLRIPTPAKSTPASVAEVVAQICAHFADDVPAHAPVGVTVPAPSLDGVVPMMANLHKSWVGADAASIFSDVVGRPVAVVNDADAAGIAEARHGAARDVDGLVILTTLGTGIGTALLHDGVLIPNSELGHLEIDGHNAESRAAASARENEKLDWATWARRLQRYYETVEMLLHPQLFVVGGGVSKHSEKYLPLLSLRTPIVPAMLRNKAGIIGAAQVAHEKV